MCGIVGASARRNIAEILMAGLKRLEYRGYDSAGIAVINNESNLDRTRVLGKVDQLQEALNKKPVVGNTGIAHTRWATHGAPSKKNAHPHISNERIAVVHNGIIENYEEHQERLEKAGYTFDSETDTEVITHGIHEQLDQGCDILAAVKNTIKQLEGAYAIAVIDADEPGRLIVARCGSPLVIGVGFGENYIASDHLALLPVTQRFIYLEEGDVADITVNKVTIYDENDELVRRSIKELTADTDVISKGNFRHFMLKEIYEQADVIQATLEGRLTRTKICESTFGNGVSEIMNKAKRVHIVACGTSFHAAFVASYWLESLAGMPTRVEIASEFRYRNIIVEPDTLFITISQSGETADTLAALRKAKEKNYLGTLAICNVPGSSLARESDHVLLTRAGPEIGVASTKAFTTQLVSLLLVIIALGRQRGIEPEEEKRLVQLLKHLPGLITEALELNKSIKTLAKKFIEREHCLYLGRGNMYPIALEGALKMKEISYIHAEAYPAGELKHGPLALVDKEMPVIAVAPNDELMEKLKSNLEEVRARGGELIVFADETVSMKRDGITVINVPQVDRIIAPIVYTIPLQLLAYHVAVFKGTDVDQPRNLAKSVTVE